MADVVPQPQDARDHHHGPADDEPPPTRPVPGPTRRPEPPVGSRARRTARAHQPPLLLPVPGAGTSGGGADAGGGLGDVLAVIAVAGHDAALARYGGRLVTRALNADRRLPRARTAT